MRVGNKLFDRWMVWVVPFEQRQKWTRLLSDFMGFVIVQSYESLEKFIKRSIIFYFSENPGELEIFGIKRIQLLKNQLKDWELKTTRIYWFS